jgi:hypothetical protein
VEAEALLFEFHDVSTSLVKDFSHFGQEFLSFLVELCAFFKITLVRIKLSNDFLDTTQPIVDF